MPSCPGQSSTAKSNAAVLLLYVAQNPNNYPPNRPSTPPTPSQVHHTLPTRSSALHPVRHLAARTSTSRPMRMVSLKRTCGAWRWKPTSFDALQAIHTTRYISATLFSHLHRERHRRSNRIERCAERAHTLPGHPGGHLCRRAASV